MNDYSYSTADPSVYDLLKEHAKWMRKNPAEAEAILWDCLKRKALGQSFRRQHIIGQYIADFICLSAKVIVELDGGYHHFPEVQDSDEIRTRWLQSKGFLVIRFSNDEVISNTNEVLKRIKVIIDERK